MFRFAHCLALLATTAMTQCWLPDSQAGDARQLEQLTDQAQQASAEGNHDQAVELLDQAIAISDSDAGLYRWRGREQFRLGRIEESVKDFDRVAKIAPQLENTLWERGISLYYAKTYDRGAQQFELYQTYHDADVENAAWRYLCVAQASGAEKARQSLLPIKNDRRVPMMAIYALYQGNAAPGDVFAAAKAGQPGEAELNRRLFYAHLYVGLHHEVAGNAAQAKKHIAQAVAHPIDHYMHDVARVHHQLMEKASDDR